MSEVPPPTTGAPKSELPGEGVFEAKGKIAEAPTSRPFPANWVIVAGFQYIDDNAPLYDGSKVRVGHKINGPAIIEEPFTTIVLHPKQTATLDRFGNYRITVK